jgi:hypothetical protein
VADDREKLLLGVSASDNVDGDVTDSIIIEAISSMNADGTRSVSYGAFDEAGNVGRAVRKMRYSDYEPPKFALSKPLLFAEGEGADIRNYLTAEDVIDGDISGNIKILDGTAQYNLTGYYTVVVAVSNSCNDYTELELNVNVESLTSDEKLHRPLITLSEYLVYVSLGEQFDPSSYISGVNSSIEGEEIDTAGININSYVDTGVPCTYEVVYTVSNSKGYMGTANMVVVVRE